ncbi:unnamed protein product [Acanthoscelides obtectus]|uniref:Uncharacterized protein n=1 Tax=Acanthoscelides obtectus TaxID=200917 RepID=A0A9P0KUW4_ACAOB|nr:unnamed protein product [Acanthoscelides obtectus]CAK1677655.1 hypothetical protein AOBTE_LOCUS31465 [Acanthoscelides obtectus]
MVIFQLLLCKLRTFIRTLFICSDVLLVIGLSDFRYVFSMTRVYLKCF